MAARPDVSIIIPVLNEAATIASLLDDLQTLRPRAEIICVDGGSVDGTPEIITGRVDRLIHGAAGRAVQMNLGAAHASSGILWFLHADSRLASNAVDALLQAISDQRPWGRFDVRLSGQRRIFRVVETMMNLRSRYSGIATGDQGIFVTRRAFDAVGGFPAIPLMEDIALSRALLRNHRPACLRNPVIVTSSRRWEENGPLRTILLMWRLRLAYRLGVRPEHLVRQYQ